MQKKRTANNARFLPGTTGACEAQLWPFVGSQRMLKDDDAPEVHWVAAESLDAALRYMRQRYDDFIITDAPFLDDHSPPLWLPPGRMSPASAAREITKPKAGSSQLRAN